MENISCNCDTIEETMYTLQLTLVLLCGFHALLFGAGNPITKRGIFNDDYGTPIQALPDFPSSGFNDFSTGPFLPLPAPPTLPSQPFLFPKPVLIQKAHHDAPTPAEIAAAVAAAKEATANVMAAQQRVHVAKEDVIAQQRIASHKEAQAALALQQTEAAAAIQRQQASAAANAVVLAQQRLAQAKADVAEQQRIAAEKESAAAVAIQKSATAAAAEIKKTESTAAKVAALQSSEAAAALKHVTAAKGATLAATSAAVAAATGHTDAGIEPWQFPGKIVHFAPWG